MAHRASELLGASALCRRSGKVQLGPVPEPGHLRRAGLSQSPPKEVPRRYLRQNRLAGLERHNGQRARPSSVGRCADRREIPCSECASSAELIWTVPSLWFVLLAKSTVVVCTAGKQDGRTSRTSLSADRPSSRRSPLPSISTPRLA